MRFHVNKNHKASILEDKLFFSQDGKFIFIVFTIESDKKFWKIILFDSSNLTKNCILEFEKVNTSKKEKGDPQFCSIF